MAGNSNTREGKTIMVPKTEDLDYELPPYTTFSGDVGLMAATIPNCYSTAAPVVNRGFSTEANGASSSGGKLRAFFIGMGFLPRVVDKVIEENGISCEENSETLLEALLRFSVSSAMAHKSNCDSSDSLSGFHNTSSGTRAPNIYHDGHFKEASGVIIWDGKWLLLDSFDNLLLDHLMSIPASFMLERSDFSVRSDMMNEELVSCAAVALLVSYLVQLSALQKSNSLSSDSLDSLFDDKDLPEVSNVNQAKEMMNLVYISMNMHHDVFQLAIVVDLDNLASLLCLEIDELNRDIDDKRGSLLMMNFSIEEVEFAIRKLGGEASIPELVDFIFALQIAKKLKKEPEDITYESDEVSNEKLFGIMAKTLQLFEMGFSENEVSSAIDKLGTEAPISELANFIFAEQNGVDYVMEYKFPTTPAYSVGIKDEPDLDLCGTTEVKAENFSHDPPQSSHANVEEIHDDTRVKGEEGIDEFPNNVSDQYSNFVENERGKRPKYEHHDSISYLDPCLVEERVDSIVAELSKRPKPNPPRCLSSVAAKPPFFLFGNVSSISYDSWGKMSQFLYGIEPEFVNTQSFSALDRIEGYIHNLPVENRFHILPKPPMTIEEAMPRTKKWWPPWDSRKQLSRIYCETSGVAQTCDRLGNVLADAGGVLTYEMQKDIIRYCRGLNLVWIGKFKLGPVEPEQLELILGYPSNHTRAAEGNLAERLKSLKYCFQTDTLGYHLSVLKPIFPHGLTMLSLFSGIGGAEIALHRLDIKIKAVVSVETSVQKRKILERWWRQSGQTGSLVQIEDIQKLTSKKLEGLISRFGGFDLVIYQNPCSYSSSRLQTGAGLSALDFSVFCECVRVLQRIRGLCQRK
ncbi:inactive DNA (cytosine-5)-methyltransferase [Vigna angularis]|uniref:DNA (cytosine-5-)-methyltransferase n=1 Tax=Phaseolus angularis TaxID=3914 RepID=A0A8T0L610_PHAAN|nr:inactive DNA (cytosine-5)-methyltransferase [Vigna angularis]